MMDIGNVINEEILAEGISDILYHFTYTGRLNNILKENKFFLTTNIGTTSDQLHNKFYYFSTQRSNGMSGYGKVNGDCCMKLDGRKLGYQQKGAAVDYWGWSKKRSDYGDDKDAYTNALLSTEMEDRIISDKPEIDNAKSFILEIHILINDRLSREYYSDVINNAGDIPVYFYNDSKDYKLLNKRKSVDISKSGLVDKDNTENRDIDRGRTFSSLGPIIAFGNSGKVSRTITSGIGKWIDKIDDSGMYNTDGWLEKHIGEFSDGLEELKYYKSKTWDDNHEQYLRTLNADINNAKRDKHESSREMINMLVNDMKRLGVSNTKDYLSKKFIGK